MRKQGLQFAVIIFGILLSFLSSAQETAKVNIKIKNRPYLQVQNYTFFKEQNEYLVNKIDQENFTLTYLSKKPSLIYINLKPVYICPGDTIDLVYSMLGQDPDVIKDTLIVKGNNVGNYTLSRFIDKKPKNFHPNFRMEIGKRDVFSIYRQQKEKYEVHKNYLANKLSNERSLVEIIEFFKRDTEIDFMFDLLYYEEILKESKHRQLKPFSNLIDSIFLKTKFLASDTSYRYGMERLFRQYFSRQVNLKFNDLSEKADYDKILSYITQYPDEFVKEYFVYFLAMDFQNLLAK